MLQTLYTRSLKDGGSFYFWTVLFHDGCTTPFTKLRRVTVVLFLGSEKHSKCEVS